MNDRSARHISPQITLPLALCLFVLGGSAAYLYVGFPQAEAGLKFVGHYALVPEGHTELITIGSGPDNHVRTLGDAPSNAARAWFNGAEWLLSTGESGGIITGSGAAPARNDYVFPGPGTYELTRAGRRVVVTVDDMARLRADGTGRLRNSVLLPLVPGQSWNADRVWLLVCDSDRILVESSATTASRCGVTSSPQPTFVRPDCLSARLGIWLSGSGSCTAGAAQWLVGPSPVRVVVREPGEPDLEHTVWPGGTAITIDAVQSVISLSGARAAGASVVWPHQNFALRLASMDPRGSVTVARRGTPSQQAGAIARMSGRRVKLGGRAEFQLQTTSLSGVGRILAFYRTHGLDWVRAKSVAQASGSLLASADDGALYEPYRRTTVLPCSEPADRQQAVWVRAAADNVSAQLVSGPMAARAVGTDKVRRLPPPRPVTGSLVSQGLMVCSDGAAFDVTSLDEKGPATHSALAAVADGSGWPPRPAQPPGQTRLAANDVIFFGGQILQLVPGGRRAAEGVLFIVLPLLLLATAAPLALHLGAWQVRAVREIGRLKDVQEGLYLRRLAAITPGLALPLLLGLMLVGMVYQLRLATDSALVANPVYLRTVAVADVLALVAASALVAALTAVRPESGRPGLMARAGASVGAMIRLAAPAALLASIVVCWIEPALYRGTAPAATVWQGATDVPLSFSLIPIAPGVVVLLCLRSVRRALSAATASIGRTSMGTHAHRLRRRIGDSTARPGRWLRDRWHAYRPASLYERFVDPYERRFEEHLGKPVGQVTRFLWLGLLVAATVWAYAMQRLTWYAVPIPIVILVGLAWFLPGGRWFLVWLRRLTLAVGSTLLFFLIPIAIGVVLASVGLGRNSIGKEFIPPVLLLAAAVIGGHMSEYVLALHRRPSGAGSVRRVRGSAVVILAGAVAFGAFLAAPPYWVSLVFADEFLILWGSAIALALLTLSLTKAGYGPALLLRTALPFLAGLAVVALLYRDYGSAMVWAWSLSLVTAWALVLSTLTDDTTFGVRPWALTGAVALAMLPFTVLSLVDFIREREAGLAIASGLGRAFQRFELVPATFYFDVGEWVARARLMAAGLLSQGWIPNLNSDLALIGLAALLPSGLNLFAGFFLTLGALLAFSLACTFRLVTVATPDQQRARIRATLVLAAAVFGTGMLMLIHLNTALSDLLPLTGVPAPWVSNANLTHLSITCLILCALTMGALVARSAPAANARVRR
jgi:hypothetical protein